MTTLLARGVPRCGMCGLAVVAGAGGVSQSGATAGPGDTRSSPRARGRGHGCGSAAAQPCPHGAEPPADLSTVGRAKWWTRGYTTRQAAVQQVASSHRIPGQAVLSGLIAQLGGSTSTRSGSWRKPMQTLDVTTVRADLDAQVQGKTLCDVLLRNLREHPDQLALSWKAKGGWHHLTWAEYRQRVAEVAMGLTTLGVGRGDFVALMLRNRPEHVIADLGAVHLGATAVSLYNTLAPEQIGYIAAHCEAKVAIVEDRAFMERWEKVRADLPALRWVVMLKDTDAFADYDWVVSWDDLVGRGREALASAPEALEDAWKAVQPDDPATLIYTSGTTGPPKGVVITHRNALWTAASVERWSNEYQDRLPSDLRYLSYLPLAQVPLVLLPRGAAGHGVHARGAAVHLRGRAAAVGEGVRRHQRRPGRRAERAAAQDRHAGDRG